MCIICCKNCNWNQTRSDHFRLSSYMQTYIISEWIGWCKISISIHQLLQSLLLLYHDNYCFVGVVLFISYCLLRFTLSSLLHLTKILALDLQPDHEWMYEWLDFYSQKFSFIRIRTVIKITYLQIFLMFVF